MGRNARPTIETDAGTEIECAKCNEFWPMDPEFFYISNGVPHSWCKACYLADPKVLAKRQRFVEKEKAEAAARRAARQVTKPQAGVAICN